jgi:hypothetical protein
MGERPDWHLTSTTEPFDHCAFSSQRHSRTHVPDCPDHFSCTIVVLSNLDGNDALTRRWHAQLDGE